MRQFIDPIQAVLRRRPGELGQALVLFAAGLAFFLALVGLSVDVGLLLHARTELQKEADAAALAGAQDLPSVTLATSVAKDYVTQNTGDAATAEVTIGKTYTDNDTITVKTNRYVNYTFLRAIGLNGANVSATAKVRKNTYSGGSGVVPWGFIASNNDNSKLLQNSCFISASDTNGDGLMDQVKFKQNQSCTIKYGAGTSSGGDFGALAIDGTGASEYRDDIAHGGKTPIKVGDKLEPQTGNMVGPTGQGIDDRFAVPPPDGCKSNDEKDVLTTNSDGSVSITPGCEASARIIIVPVVDRINNPEKSTVLGFAYLYLIGESGGGGHTQVDVKFVQFVTEIPNSVYNGAPGGAGAVAIKMIE